MARHDRVAHEDRGYHALHMGLSGPHEFADKSEGKVVAHTVVAVLRLHDANHRRSILLPWVKTIWAKAQCEVLEATDAILDETPAPPLKGIPFDNRVLRIHTDRGGEWVNAPFRQELKKRNPDEMYTQGYTSQSKGAAQRCVGLMKTIGRRMASGG